MSRAQIGDIGFGIIIEECFLCAFAVLSEEVLDIKAVLDHADLLVEIGLGELCWQAEAGVDYGAERLAAQKLDSAGKIANAAGEIGSFPQAGIALAE